MPDLVRDPAESRRRVAKRRPETTPVAGTASSLRPVDSYTVEPVAGPKVLDRSPRKRGGPRVQYRARGTSQVRGEAVRNPKANGVNLGTFDRSRMKREVQHGGSLVKGTCGASLVRSETCE